MSDDVWYDHPAPEFDRKFVVADVNNTALIVLDMQEHFRGMATPIIKNVVETIQAAREFKIPIIFTQHGYNDVKLDGGRLAEWWQQNIMFGSDDWKLMKEIKLQQGDSIVYKKRYDAFVNTDLKQVLHKHNIQTVALCGVMTNLCVETTARAAFNLDYNVLVLGDSCATRDRDMQRASLVNLAFGFARIVSHQQFIKQLRRSASWSTTDSQQQAGGHQQQQQQQQQQQCQANNFQYWNYPRGMMPDSLLKTHYADTYH